MVRAIFHPFGASRLVTGMDVSPLIFRTFGASRLVVGGRMERGLWEMKILERVVSYLGWVEGARRLRCWIFGIENVEQ